MYSQKANSSSVMYGQKMKSSANTLGKKSTKQFKSTKDGHSLFSHRSPSTSSLEKVKHERR